MTLHIDETESVLRVRTLGSFSVNMQGKVLSSTSARSQRVWKLFKYIITNRTKPIPVERLIDVLWPEAEVENPVKALYTLIYRLRLLLNQFNETPIDYIVFQHNSYLWNTEAPSKIDAEVFEEYAKKGDDTSLPSEERIAYYHDALQLYQGDYLTESASEDWVVPWINYYKRIYNSLTDNLCALHMERKEYEQILRVSERAIELDPFDETAHEWLITALIELEQYAQAIAHYDHIANLLYRELGVQPSDSLQRLYQSIHRDNQYIQYDIKTIKENLREPIESLNGAFLCDYDVFRQFYRLEARAIMRSGIAAYLVVLTISTMDRRLPDHESLSSAIDLLKDISISSLRRGDVVSQFSQSQIVYLLPSLTIEDGEMVLGRIKKKFEAIHAGSPVLLTVAMEPIEPAMQ